MPDSPARVRPEDSLEKMIASLKEKTGRSLDEWKAVIEGEGWKRHGEIVNGLKSKHGISHGYANQIALRSLAAPLAPDSDPVAEMFAKRPEAKAVYEELRPKLEALGSDVEFAPKKGYLSVRRRKQFAILQPAAGRLDVGVQLPGVETTSRLEASGSFNAMLSHRIRLKSPVEVDDELMRWLTAAYQAAV